MTATLRTLTTAALASVTLAAFAQAQSASFPAGTELVTVDAVVLDGHGQPVTGLTAADFTLLEDGHAQSITAFEAVDRPAAAPATAAVESAPPRTSSNVDERAR